MGAVRRQRGQMPISDEKQNEMRAAVTARSHRRITYPASQQAQQPFLPVETITISRLVDISR